VPEFTVVEFGMPIENLIPEKLSKHNTGKFSQTFINSIWNREEFSEK
jgi:hypothetical protein